MQKVKERVLTWLYGPFILHVILITILYYIYVLLKVVIFDDYTFRDATEEMYLYSDLVVGAIEKMAKDNYLVAVAVCIMCWGPVILIAYIFINWQYIFSFYPF